MAVRSSICLVPAAKTQNFLMEYGNNFSGGFFARRADSLRQPIVSELFFAGVFPFEETVGGQEKKIARGHFEAVWRVREKFVGDAEGQAVRFHQIKSVTIPPVEE